MSEVRVLAIGGGKGGVGKSFVAVNLAVCMARLGKRVVMLDADFGGANLHALLGILQPDRTVLDFVTGRVSSLSEVALMTRVPGLSILAGTCDVLGSADLQADQKRRLLAGLKDLRADVLVVDVGAGSGVQTVDLFNAADTKLLVMTPELTSIQNAYGFLKIAVYRALQRVVAGHPGEARIKEAMGESAFEIGSTMKHVDTFISLVAGEAPELERPFRLMLSQMNVSLVGNMLHSTADRKTVWAIQRMVKKFLSFEPQVGAIFGHNNRVRRTVNGGVPLTAQHHARDPDAEEFARLARRVLSQDLSQLHALRREIDDALDVAQVSVELGLDGVEIEMEEVTDPRELAELRAVERAADNVGQAGSVPPPPPADARARQRRTSGVQPAVRSDRPAPRKHSVASLPAPTPSFVAELSLVRRSRARGEVHVEVEVMGQWFFGTLHGTTDQGVQVKGIHPFGDVSGKRCRLRLAHVRVEDQEAASAAEVRWHSYNADTGIATLQFDDPAAWGAFLACLAGRTPQAANANG